MDPVTWRDLTRTRETVEWNSVRVLKQVLRARKRQAARFGDPLVVNALMRPGQVMSICRLTPAGVRLLDDGVRCYGLSARAVHRTLRFPAPSLISKGRSACGSSTSPRPSGCALERARPLRVAPGRSGDQDRRPSPCAMIVRARKPACTGTLSPYQSSD